MEKVSILLGKTIQKATRLRGNGGSALPGLVIEHTNKNFVKQVLEKLPHGVVVISGTNGKTTTTKIVSELLEKQGLKVFTNKSGSNFVRGVISAILNNIKITGKFDFDIAVLELDEAHAVKFAEQVPIDYALFLNVQRDQLDRFGEIDHTAELLQKVAKHTKQAIVLNREDIRVSKITGPKRIFFGLSENMQKDFPTDDELIAKDKNLTKTKRASKVTLEKLKNNNAIYKIDDENYPCKLSLRGTYNAYNAAGALALCATILPKVKAEKLVTDLADIKSAFGRGEIFTINDSEVELLLVKNPAAFQLSLTSFADNEHDYMIAINDNVADGRDVSWLWNVYFDLLKEVKITTGTRAADMALRLKYDDVPTKKVEEDIAVALDKFLKSNKRPKRIFATYTAMLEIRKLISGSSIL